MKATLFALFAALLMVGCGGDAVDHSKLQNRDGALYLLNEETPFTGRAKNFYDDGQKESECNYKEGIMHGLCSEWYENGQKKSEKIFKDGKQDGLETKWYDNGQKEWEGNFNDDYLNGITTFWYKNGQKKGEMKRKDRFLISAEVWKPNGEKCPETKIDEEGNGIVFWYKEDGTEDYGSIYKDGELAGLTP